MQAEVQTEPQDASTMDAIRRFDEAFNRHDVDAIMAEMTDDCVFESTYPPPDGKRYEGQDAVREVWNDFFRSSPDAIFETEELFVAGDRCTGRWIYRNSGADGAAHHIRGFDVFKVRDGKVAEKLSYVKG